MGDGVLEGETERPSGGNLMTSRGRSFRIESSIGGRRSL